MTTTLTHRHIRLKQNRQACRLGMMLSVMGLAFAIAVARSEPVLAQAPPSPAIKDGLAAIDKQDFPKAMQAFDKAFKDGDAEGGFYLGRIAELGLGIPANPAAAAILYKAAADKGSPKALNRVGLMQFRGENGVLQDYELAKTNMCKAADLGEKDAMFNCAEIHYDGKHAPKNVGQAIKYYGKAADDGHVGALNVLGMLHRDGKDVAKDAPKARTYFERSAAKGNPVGLFELGRIEEDARNFLRAHIDYNLASARNHPRGPEALQRVSAQMTVGDIAAAQADARKWKATP